MFLTFVMPGPGSFLEVRKILPLLTDSSPEHPSFHVVAISLPGYGFSEAPHKQGFAAKQYAEVVFLHCTSRASMKVMMYLGSSQIDARSWV